MPILLVIDMQPRFKASAHAWLLANVEREILAAKSAGWGIMFLEYTRAVGRGGVKLANRTYDSLTRLVADYAHAVTVHKEGDDGSCEVLHAAEWWYSRKIRVVGVNTEACVALTVNGLSRARPDIEIAVVGDACNGQLEARGGSTAPGDGGQDKIVTEGRNVCVLKVA